MTEKKNRNDLFIHRHYELKADGKTLTETQIILCGEFGITGHSYRAWKSRLHLQYKGRYKKLIAPFLVVPKSKLLVAVAVTCDQGIEQVQEIAYVGRTDEGKVQAVAVFDPSLPAPLAAVVEEAVLVQ